MAYNTKYQFEWNTDLEQPLTVYLKKKDTEAGAITVYAVDACHFEYNSQGQTIFGASVMLGVAIGKDETSIMPDFENIEKDTWQMEVWLNETVNLFTGYVLPDECREDFQDPPYTVTLTATDQMGLISDTPLLNTDGTEFRGEAYLIEYLAAAIQQTGINLPIMVFDHVYHRLHLNRDDDPKWDLMGQTKLEYRTFLRDAVTFMSAREAIEAILFPAYFLYQWNGHWVVFRKELLQYWPFAKYYTVYDADGKNAVGYEILEDYATVGKDQMIYPINETQVRSLNFAVRHAKSIYDYVIWPEIPKNNTLDLGVMFGSGDAIDTEDINNNGDTTERIGTYTDYVPSDWQMGAWNGNAESINLLPDLLPTGSVAYIRKTVDDFAQEISRHLAVPKDVNTPAETIRNVVFSEGIPVIQGDRLSFSFDMAGDYNLATGEQNIWVGAIVGWGIRTLLETLGSDTVINQTCVIMLRPTGGGSTLYVGRDDATGTYVWEKGTNLKYVREIDITDTSRWSTYHITTGDIPVAGKLYIGFISPDFYGVNFYKNIKIDFEYLLGGREVKGDYWLHGQSRSLSDVLDQNVKLSDTPRKIFKGCLLGGDGEPLTADWYRLGLNESKHYKQLSNLSAYNFNYRRFAKIEGDFTGITCQISNNQEIIYPIALHIPYRMVDEAGDRRYRLIAPLRADLYTGNIIATFEEVYQSDPAGVLKLEPVNRLVSRIRTAIDNKTAAEWGSGGFDPYTGNVLAGSPNKFSVAMPTGVTMDVETTGATVTKSESDFLGFNIVTFTITKYAVGDTITFSAWTGEVTVTVEQITTDPADGQETGDYNDFKYIFN